jgi:hypothetical protein
MGNRRRRLCSGMVAQKDYDKKYKGELREKKSAFVYKLTSMCVIQLRCLNLIRYGRDEYLMLRTTASDELYCDMP